MAHCSSSGFMDLATQLPSSYKTWEVAKVALSCHEAMDMFRQELHEVERDAAGSGSERVFSFFAEEEGSE